MRVARDEDKSENPVKQTSIRDLAVEPGAEDVLESAAMDLYMNLAMEMMGGNNTRPAIRDCRFQWSYMGSGISREF